MIKRHRKPEKYWKFCNWNLAYNFLQGYSPPTLYEVFVERDFNYNLLGNNFLSRWRVNSVRYGTESVSFLAPKTWDILTKEIKNPETFNIFKCLVDFVKHICRKQDLSEWQKSKMHMIG